MDSNIFQIDSEYAKSAYQSKNFEIEYTANSCEIKYCTIYFSSHNIYYPNTPSEFRKRIMEQDYYEWRNYKTNVSQKHIYVRDIFKQWYLTGINNEINTPEKLLDFLKRETKQSKPLKLESMLFTLWYKLFLFPDMRGNME